MSRKSKPDVIETVHYGYVGSDDQYNTFLKSIIKDYISYNNLLPDDYNGEKTINKKSA
jgi:hypothetical protein